MLTYESFDYDDVDYENTRHDQVAFCKHCGREALILVSQSPGYPSRRRAFPIPEVCPKCREGHWLNEIYGSCDALAVFLEGEKVKPALKRFRSNAFSHAHLERKYKDDWDRDRIVQTSRYRTKVSDIKRDRWYWSWK